MFEDRRLVLIDDRIPRHQKVNDDVDRTSPVARRNAANQLEFSKILALLAVMLHEGSGEKSVLAIAECLGIETKIHIESPDMRHLMIVQKKPRYGPSNNREFALKTSENLTDFNEHRFHRSGCAVVISVCTLGIGSA
jgi:hypothetical protein